MVLVPNEAMYHTIQSFPGHDSRVARQSQEQLDLRPWISPLTTLYSNSIIIKADSQEHTILNAYSVLFTICMFFVQDYYRWALQIQGICYKAKKYKLLLSKFLHICSSPSKTKPGQTDHYKGYDKG